MHYNTTNTEPLTAEYLKEYFLEGCKRSEERAVGVEWEKIGVYRDTGEAIPYSGPRGVKAIFEALISRYGWSPINASDGQPIALKKGEGSVTLEPGGQIELSGQKALRIAENAQELYRHLCEIRKVSDPLGIAWLGLGAQPFSKVTDIEWVPKDRYAVMRQSLADMGSLTHSMMKQTASVQMSIDYVSEKDAIDKLRLAMALSPVLTAMFANSPLENGERSPYLSRRAHIWQNTAPERSGILWQVFDKQFGFEDYVRYALEVPLLFLQREGRWLRTDPIPFGKFMKDGWKGHKALVTDWDLHLTSIFTEARLKKYLEIRGIDCQATPMGLAAVALIKGLFYSESSQKAAWSLVNDQPAALRKRLYEEVPRTGLGTRTPDGTLLELALELERLASSGLPDDERPYLIPLREMLAMGRCPADKIFDCLGNATEKADVLRQVILCCGV